MSNAAGFDMVPPLSDEAADKKKWASFIEAVKAFYQDDSQVEIMSNYIDFCAGDYLKLPYEGHKFLRFSSEISVPTATIPDIDGYIEFVTCLAQAHFDRRIHCWNQRRNQHGVHDWKAVNRSIKSYERPDGSETSTRITIRPNYIGMPEEIELPLFEIRDIPGKGRGLIAVVDIPTGSCILCEKPLLVVEPNSYDKLESLIMAKLKPMPEISQRQFLSLHNIYAAKCPATPLSGIFQTNALPCGPDSDVKAIYATACLINHSCMPNAYPCWNAKEKHQIVHAIRPIAKGTEITISYGEENPSIARQIFLRRSFGFTCTCPICCLPSPLLQASDNRRIQILSLYGAIDDPFRMAVNPEDSLADCYALLRLFDKEFDGVPGLVLVRTYFNAFQICIGHGDQARASVFARRAYEANLIIAGEDSPETRKMKRLEQRPAKYALFQEHSKKWHTGRAMIPKNSDARQFEKWLFRQE